MVTALARSALALALLALGCASPTKKDTTTSVGTTGGNGGAVAGSGGSGGGTGGSGGSPTGGSGGSGGSSTGGSGGSSTGGSGGSSTGGSGGSSTGGSGGSGGSTTPAADAATDAMMSLPPDAASNGDGGWDPGVPAFPGKAGIYLCPKEWDQTKCCAFLCQCLEHTCTDSPMDAGRIPGCMAMCGKLTDARARCQVFHCFESNSPSGKKDHASHCGHASGRVGGGDCSIIK
jgi:hypothetical protein